MCLPLSLYLKIWNSWMNTPILDACFVARRLFIVFNVESESSLDLNFLVALLVCRMKSFLTLSPVDYHRQSIRITSSNPTGGRERRSAPSESARGSWQNWTPTRRSKPVRRPERRPPFSDPSIPDLILTTATMYRAQLWAVPLARGTDTTTPTLEQVRPGCRRRRARTCRAERAGTTATRAVAPTAPATWAARSPRTSRHLWWGSTRRTSTLCISRRPCSHCCRREPASPTLWLGPRRGGTTTIWAPRTARNRRCTGTQRQGGSCRPPRGVVVLHLRRSWRTWGSQYSSGGRWWTSRWTGAHGRAGHSRARCPVTTSRGDRSEEVSFLFLCRVIPNPSSKINFHLI